VSGRTEIRARSCRKNLLLKAIFSMHICDMLIGYARVSTDDQDLRLQRAALKEAGAAARSRRRCRAPSATGPSSSG